MTAAKMARLIGREGMIRGERAGLGFRVKVLDARVRFGAVDVLVEPVAGIGTAWVAVGSVTLDGEG